MQKSRDLRVRSFRFAVDVVNFSRAHLVDDAIVRRLAYQLVDAAGSVGANLEESGGGQTKPDFITKQFVALKEIREANFWLRVIAEAYPAVRLKLAPLLQESGELKAMITASVLTPNRIRTADRQISGKNYPLPSSIFHITSPLRRRERGSRTACVP